MPEESPEDVKAITWMFLLSGGIRLRRNPDDDTVAEADTILVWMEGLKGEIDQALPSPIVTITRPHEITKQLNRHVLHEAGTRSGADAFKQATELWHGLDDESKLTMSLAFLMHRATRPEVSQPALTVLRYALDPSVTDL